ncbi:MAG: hypothetical protein KF681_17975 [Bdellovibrionaceae bacterium]|nr:hypothetical protein [Pseudobdellovibrionaceae bacterium]
MKLGWTLTLLALTGCSVSALARDVRSEEFQILAQDQAFEAKAAALNLEDPSYQLEYKPGGTSLGLKIKDPAGKSVGKFLPANGAANSEAQLVSHRLAQFLRMSALVVPSAPYTIGPRTTQIFYGMLTSANERNQWRRENQDELIEKIRANPNSLAGVLTPKTDEWEALDVANPDANTINRAHPIAQFIRADGPRPTTREMSLKGVKAKNGSTPTQSELELSRQFSQIMVLDLLCGQWDRWSGGNVEASIDGNGKLFFFARDNGGASMRGTNQVTTYLKIVSRFDRAQIQRVQRLADLLSGPERNDLITALRLKSDASSLLARAQALLQHVRGLTQQWGEQNVYF